MASSGLPECVKKEPACIPRLAFITIRPRKGQQKSQSSQRFILVFKLNHWCSFKLYSSAQLKLYRGMQGNWCLRKMALQNEKLLSRGNLVAVPSVFSPEPFPPRFSSCISSLFYLSSAGAQVSVCKKHFVHCPFKRLAPSLALSPWRTETLLFFTTIWYLGSFPCSGAVSWEAQFRV